MELSAAAQLSFDLSKFTYDAARAGVVPSLGDCAITSRKSSASCTKSTNMGTVVNTTEPLNVQEDRFSRPDRQPHVPPPVERQKDEGFATFLKKHSSPTHNRVTTGGRIVPMEPRSPPPFSLPTIATNRPLALTASQQLSTFKVEDNTYNGAVRTPHNYNFDTTPFNGTHVVGAPVGHELGASPRQMFAGSDTTPVYFEPQGVTNGYSLNTAITSPIPQTVYPSMQAGGMSMQNPVQSQPFSIGQYLNANSVYLGTGVSLSDHYNASASWPAYSQSPEQQHYSPQDTSPYQMLVAWQQQFYDLDQQLKTIDRHRAMRSFDPELAKYRKEIVQKRSDAKEIIKEYQDMLGLRRQVDSSQDSFATNFNVDAPAYVPRGEAASIGDLGHQMSWTGTKNGIPTEKPRGNVQRRAIPIIAPPVGEKSHCSTEICALPSIGSSDSNQQNHQYAQSTSRVQSHTMQPVKTINAEQMQQMTSHGEGYLGTSASQSSGQPSEGGLTVETNDWNIRPADDTPPRDINGEYLKLIEAVSQAKGIVTQVRLLDNRVIDVEGQGLGLLSLPLSGTDQHWEKPNKVAPAASKHFKATSLVTQEPIVVMGNENISVKPRNHQKAATDAFLAQFNAIDDEMALNIKHVTRSLRNTSNGGLGHGGHHSSYFADASTNHTTTESLHRPVNGNMMGRHHDTKPSNHGMNIPVAEQTLSLHADTLKNKGYSSVSIQNIHAVGNLPSSFDGVVEGHQGVQARLAIAGKAKSPRLLRRHGRWAGPFCRDIAEKVRVQNHFH